MSLRLAELGQRTRLGKPEESAVPSGVSAGSARPLPWSQLVLLALPIVLGVGRSHSDAWVGCMVWSTTACSSAARVSRSIWSRRRALNTSRLVVPKGCAQ